MGKTRLDDIYIFKISIKIRFSDVSIGIKIQFFRVSVTIEPGRSLLQFVTIKCLIIIIPLFSGLKPTSFCCLLFVLIKCIVIVFNLFFYIVESNIIVAIAPIYAVCSEPRNSGFSVFLSSLCQTRYLRK